ncbi:MAG: N-acetyl-gamma-glutamyl-phosphate reductase [Myxococcota bacterium]|nr:N-acetyl-gamma-glutamyl-phosphate reductase [Myxococcota bacterium]
MTKKRFKAAIIGGSGYGGGEMIRRLLMHPEVELVRVASIDFIGQTLDAAHPNLSGLDNYRFEDLSPTEAAKDVDIALLGLPHKVTAHKVPELLKTGVKIIDMSGDFRLQDVSAYEKFYQAKHPCPEHLDKFVYGLPELNRERIAKAQYVASPGCFATTIELGLLPFAQKGWLKGAVETVAMTGSSGSGVKPSAGTHHPVRAQNIKTYKTLRHQHTPEIEETMTAAGAEDFKLQFVPISAPLSRGILATSFLHIDENIRIDEIEAAYQSTYGNAKFVRKPEGRLPEVAAVSGTNYVEVGYTYGSAQNGKRVITCFSALDNLIKGGAGQAIQSMNIVLGLDESLSLSDYGSWP